MEARNLGIINGVQSYLVESNRSGSVIDVDAPESNNSRWTSQTNLELQRGDRVSVECVAIESTGASSNSSIEFSGENIKRGDAEQNFTDDQVILEFNFYLQNNGHNTINLPIQYTNELEVDKTTPFIPSIELQGTSTLPKTEYLQHCNAGTWGGINSLTGSYGGQPSSVAAPYGTGGLSPNQTMDYQFPSCSYTSQPGRNWNQPDGGPLPYHAVTAYDLFGVGNTNVAGLPPPPPIVLPLNVGVQFDYIVISKAGDAGVLNLTCEFQEETMPLPQEYDTTGKNIPFQQGMTLLWENNNPIGGIPSKVIAAKVIGVEPDYDNTTLVYTGRARVNVVRTEIPAGYFPVGQHSQVICVSYTPPTDTNPDGSVKKNYAGYSDKPVCSQELLGPDGITPLNAYDNDYQKGGRMGIGLYNQTAQPVLVVGETSPESSVYIQRAIAITMMRGGALLWEQTRCYGPPPAASIPQLGCNIGAGTQGLKPLTLNMRDYKDNNAYILTRPDYMGPQPHPNGRGLCPTLEPLSCFVHVKADSAFEDVNSLANLFTNAFHAINKLLTTQGDSLQKYIENAEYPFNKKNQVFPLFAEGFFDPPDLATATTGSGGPGTYKKAALWSRVAPMWLGNCVKCIPANLDTACDWKYQVGAPYYYWANDVKDYLKTGLRGDWCWDNQIYGNMALRDFAKCKAGDRLVRLECWDGNTNTHPHRDIPRPVVLNTQLPKYSVFSAGSGYKPADTFSMVTTEILLGQAIFTNIQFENTGWEYMAGADPDPLSSGYLPNATPAQIKAIRLRRYKNLDEIQFAMRTAEKYMIQGNLNTVNGRVKQEQQPWWIYGMDLGMSRGDYRLNEQEIVTPYPVGTGNRFGIMTPVQTNWMPEAPASTNNGVVTSHMFAKEWNNNPAAPQTENTDIPAGWSWITPTQSVVGCGAEVNFQQAKAMGNLNVFSRWNDTWDIPILEQQAQGNLPSGAQGYMPSNLYERNVIGGVRNQPGSCRVYNYDPPYNFMYDVKECRDRNIGCFPYKYVDEDGTHHQLLAFCCAKNYQAKSDEEGSSVSTATRASWEMCDLNWGDMFGFSPQFGYDQPTVIPINNDVIADPLELNLNPTETNFKPRLKYKANNVNHVWVGAADAKMVWDAGKNRYELGGLYTTNNLSQVNAGSGTNSQVGETVAQLNTNALDTAGVLPNTNSSIGGITYDFDYRNQGIEDAVCGLALANLYHCPKNWKPPENLNPQNLTSPYMNNSNSLNTDPYVAGQTDVNEFLNQTEENYKTFRDGITLATAANWEGTILNKMGFEYDQMMPYQGSQENRYSDWTYGKDNVAIQAEGVKPLMLNALLDTAATQVLNTWASRDPTTPATAPSIVPPYGIVENNGTTLYRNGTLNNQPISIDADTGAKLTARNTPSLYSCPYYIILTDLVPTQFQKGAMSQNSIYYGLKSYSAGQYFYIYGSQYSQLVQNPRLVQSITTELRNPLTGELARVGRNSSIIYKVERDISLPPITMTGDGKLIDPKTEQPEPVADPIPAELRAMFSQEAADAERVDDLLVADRNKVLPANTPTGIKWGGYLTGEMIGNLNPNKDLLLEAHNLAAKMAAKLHARDGGDLDRLLQIERMAAAENPYQYMAEMAGEPTEAQKARFAEIRGRKGGKGDPNVTPAEMEAIAKDRRNSVRRERYAYELDKKLARNKALKEARDTRTEPEKAKARQARRDKGYVYEANVDETKSESKSDPKPDEGGGAGGTGSGSGGHNTRSRNRDR